MDAIEGPKVPRRGPGDCPRDFKCVFLACTVHGLDHIPAEHHPPLTAAAETNAENGMSIDSGKEGLEWFNRIPADLPVPPVPRKGREHSQRSQDATGRLGGCAPHRSGARYTQNRQQQHTRRTNIPTRRTGCALALLLATAFCTRSTVSLTAPYAPTRATPPTTTDVAAESGADDEATLMLKLGDDPRKFLDAISNAALKGGEIISPQVVYNGARSAARAPLNQPAENFVDNYLLGGEAGTHFPMEFGIAVGLPVHEYRRHCVAFGWNYSPTCKTVPLHPSREAFRVSNMIFADAAQEDHRMRMTAHIKDEDEEEGVLPYTEEVADGAPLLPRLRNLPPLPDPQLLVMPEEPGTAPPRPAYLQRTGEFGPALRKAYEDATLDDGGRKNIRGGDVDQLVGELVEGRSFESIKKVMDDSQLMIDQDRIREVMTAHGLGDETDLDAVHQADDNSLPYVVEFAKLCVPIMLKDYASFVIARAEYEKEVAAYQDALNRVTGEAQTVYDSVVAMQDYEVKALRVIDHWKKQASKSSYAIYLQESFRSASLMSQTMEARGHLARWNQQFIEYTGSARGDDYEGYEEGMQPLDISILPPLAQIAVIGLVKELVALERLVLPCIPLSGPIHTAVQMELRKKVKAEKRGPLATAIGLHAYPLYLLVAITSALAQNGSPLLWSLVLSKKPHNPPSHLTRNTLRILAILTSPGHSPSLSTARTFGSFLFFRSFGCTYTFAPVLQLIRERASGGASGSPRSW